MSPAFCFFGQDAMVIDCKSSLRLDNPLVSLQHFMYKMDFFQQNTGTISKKSVARMGETCSY